MTVGVISSVSARLLTIQEGLRQAQEDLKVAASYLRDEGGQPINAGIFFDVWTRTVKLQGTERTTGRVKMQLEDSLKKMLKLISAEDGSSTSTDCRYSPKHFSRQNLNSKSPNAIPPKIFALRTREDSEIANAWTKHILPRLASILSPNVGSDYSATLVRQGLSESSSAAVIRIQSANGQSEPIREVIRRKINQICDDNNRERIDVHFSKGKLMLLGSPSPRLPINETVQIEDNDENDENEFPHHKRYWRYPGMGASIGMRCSKTVSATLGGYILLDKKRYLISVDHFIQESEWTKDIQHSPGGVPLELTSPSLSDVEYMTADNRPIPISATLKISMNVFSVF